MDAARTITLDESDLEAMLDAAALRGALEALKRVGLHDDEAPKDVWVLRTIAKLARLWSWRMTMVAMGLFFIVLASISGGYVRRWLG